MNKVNIRFDEVNGFPILDSIKLWINSIEITDGLRKGVTLRNYMLNMPWSIRLEKEDIDARDERDKHEQKSVEDRRD